MKKEIGRKSMSLIKSFMEKAASLPADAISAAVYYGLLAPLAGVKKLRGKSSSLNFDFKNGKKSYWNKKEVDKKDSDRYKRLY